MSQPSSIDRLPSEVREALQGWLRDPAITQTEATERTNALLDELAAQQPEGKRAERVSRQAVHRYDKRMRRACERVLQSRQALEVWTEKLGSAPAGPVRIAMDQTGMGEAPTEAAKRRHGQRRVEGVLFSADNKQRLATLLKQHAEDRKMRIPVDGAVRADLHSLRRVTTPAGNVRFDVHGGPQPGGYGEKSHADRAWAAALGLYAADIPVEIFDYRPVRKQDFIGPNATRDPGPYRIRATAGFVRGVL